LGGGKKKTMAEEKTRLLNHWGLEGFKGNREVETYSSEEPEKCLGERE